MEKNLILDIINVDEDDISREITLSQSNIISVLLQIIVLESGISYLDIVLSFI